MPSNNVYYEVTGGDVLAFCRDWRDRTQAVTQVYGAYAEAKGGIGHVRQHCDRFGGVIFAGNPPLGWKRHRTTCLDGTPFYKPVKRGEGAAQGKLFEAEIDALPLLPADEEIFSVIGFPLSVNYSKADGSTGTAHIPLGFNSAQIAWINDGDSFWVVLPDLDARVANMEENGWTVTPREWTPPEGMKRSSPARYELARAAEKVAAEDATPSEGEEG